MDAEEEGQRFTAGIWNEVLQENSAHSLAAKKHKCGSEKTSWQQQKYHSTHYGEEAESVWTYLQDGEQLTCEVCGVWDDGWTDMARKTE